MLWTNRALYAVLAAAAAGTLALASFELRSSSVTAVSSTPDEFGRMIASESDKWSRIVRAINLQLQ